MKIETEICDGQQELEDFLNNEIDFENDYYVGKKILICITQDRMFYTVIYKIYE